MIEPRQVRARGLQLYRDIKKRSQPKLWKNGRMAGRTRWPGVVVPYTSEEFVAWLMATVGMNAFPCPYCGAPLDVLSMQLDHDIPLATGGDNELGNLVPTCDTCNRTKGKLCGKEFVLFLNLIRKLPPAAEADVLQRLRSGAMGLRLSRQLRAQKSGAARKSPIRQAEEEAF